ncbi:MAG: SDR family oxidoreductase [Armatimonadetes bacterium]|nr:SDR family oxidoreductase [Armatimonadota bacterium]
MRGLAEKVAVITGGGAGIGKATARRMAEEGARVTLLDWSGDDLERTATELNAQGAECLGVHGSAASPEDCERVVQQAMERWGRCDILVANAGVRRFGSLLEATEEDWEHVLAVNLKGVANACVAAANGMRLSGHGGAMVLVSSANAIVGRANMPIYDAAKAGVLSLARSLAVDLAGENIRVNSVCPGFTVTDYHVRRAEAEGRSADSLRASKSSLFDRPAEPHELAAAITFLASNDASFITATNLFVDGGRHST